MKSAHFSHKTAKPDLSLRAALSENKQIFDKQHQLREELEFKIFRKISGSNEIFQSGGKGQKFLLAKIFGTCLENSCFYVYLKMILSKVDFKTMNF